MKRSSSRYTGLTIEKPLTAPLQFLKSAPFSHALPRIPGNREGSSVLFIVSQKVGRIEYNEKEALGKNEGRLEFVLE